MSLDEIKAAKMELDRFNYGTSLEGKDGDDSLSASDYETTNMTEVKNGFNAIKTMLNERKDNYHVGVISAGTHSLDFKKYYWPEEKMDEWNTTPVMFVYECPAANSSSSLAESYVQFEKKPEETDDFQQHLCSCLWHVKESNPKYNDKWDIYRIFQTGSLYGGFLQAMIHKFRLANFYTTNMVRYEIFCDEGGKEKALNLTDMGKIFGGNKNAFLTGDDAVFLSTFKKELEMFQPRLIFATSNPFWYLNRDDIRKLIPNAVIVKIPHSASRDSNSTRYMKNFVNIIKGLEKVGIITPEEAHQEMTNVYENYPLRDCIS